MQVKILEKSGPITKSYVEYSVKGKPKHGGKHQFCIINAPNHRQTNKCNYFSMLEQILNELAVATHLC